MFSQQSATEELSRQLDNQLKFRNKLLEKIQSYRQRNGDLTKQLEAKLENSENEDRDLDAVNSEDLSLVKYFVDCNALRRRKLADLLVQKHRLLLENTLVDISQSEHIGTSVFKPFTVIDSPTISDEIRLPSEDGLSNAPNKKRASTINRALASAVSLKKEFVKKGGLQINRNPLGPAENYGFDERYSLGKIHAMDAEDDTHLFVSKGAITLQGLVKRVTSDDKSRVQLRRRLILTHQSYCKSEELLTLLAHRFFSPLPPNLTPAELRYFKKENLAKVRIKVVSVLKYWMEEHWQDDFADNQELQNKMRSFIRDMESQYETTSLGNRLTKVLERQISKQREISNTETNFGSLSGSPQAVPFALLRHPAELIAKQISLMNFHIFKKIKPRECLDQSWNKKDLKHRAPNILGLIEQWNGIDYFAKMVVLNEREYEQRAKILQHIIHVAHDLKDMCNFCGSYAIYCALKSSSIFRLKRTFELLPKSTMKQLEALDVLFLMSNNFMNLRNHMEECLSKPSIPHLGIFLQDFTFIDEGNRNWVDAEKKLINWNKYQLMAKRIELLKMFQHRKWEFVECSPILSYISDFCNVERLEELQLYEISVKLEPRDSARKNQS